MSSSCRRVSFSLTGRQPPHDVKIDTWLEDDIIISSPYYSQYGQPRLIQHTRPAFSSARKRQEMDILHVSVRVQVRFDLFIFQRSFFSVAGYIDRARYRHFHLPSYKAIHDWPIHKKHHRSSLFTTTGQPHFSTYIGLLTLAVYITARRLMMRCHIIRSSLKMAYSSATRRNTFIYFCFDKREMMSCTRAKCRQPKFVLQYFRMITGLAFSDMLAERKYADDAGMMPHDMPISSHAWPTSASNFS